MLEIYNSQTRKKQPFQPIEPGKIRMYVCGMTVYDLCHIGHARVLVVFDTVVRYLRASGFEVTYVRNITDIDDKIIKRANENGEKIGELTERFISAMHEDAEALKVLPPDIEPRATTSMEDILSMIQSLMDKEFAYQADNGDVYYAVSKFDGYGKLSGRDIEDERAGARVEVDEAKRDPLDFVLWKTAKPGEPSWDSPWGAGRPGWHIECSAMSTCCLGNTFDIHGGGLDLKFPHHENEIAQSEAATGQPFVKLWMHNGFVEINQEKMSKSLDNFFTVREVLKIYRPEEIRYFILASHYRSPLNYADENLDQARASLARLYTALRGLPADSKADDNICQGYIQRFNAAMDDDFNTPEAIAVLFDIARSINRYRDNEVHVAGQLAALLKQLGGLLGLLQDDADDYLKAPVLQGVADDGLSDDEIEAMILARNQARAEKNWAEADRLRDELQERGIVLEDAASDTSWRRE
ncbi:MAG: cysteine--tRNA ligase [Gammaproteobacteria bacterium]|nr:MAG: cysteine--tRNA ligase [Gammaproteobacteria bacterium]